MTESSVEGMLEVDRPPGALDSTHMWRSSYREIGTNIFASFPIKRSPQVPRSTPLHYFKMNSNFWDMYSNSKLTMTVWDAPWIWLPSGDLSSCPSLLIKLLVSHWLHRLSSESIVLPVKWRSDLKLFFWEILTATFAAIIWIPQRNRRLMYSKQL
jgi:hypothetical protein